MKLAKKNDGANKLLSEFSEIDETLDNAELVCTKTDGIKYDFNGFLLPLKFTEKIHNYEITLDEAINYQTELEILINKLNSDYKPRKPKKKKIEEKNKVLKSATKLPDARKDIISFFEKGTFRIKEMYLKQKLYKTIYIMYLKQKLYKTKNKTKNNELVEKIKNRWSDLKDEIKKTSEDEKEAEKPDKVLEIVEEILIFNRTNALLV